MLIVKYRITLKKHYMPNSTAYFLSISNIKKLNAIPNICTRGRK